MASNFTANYGLNQWEEEDAVRRVDFNADNAKIDAAVKAVDQRVDGLSQTVAGKASQSDLNSEASTRAAAVSALNAAVAKRGNCQIETFTYTGDGEKVRTIAFPSMPKFIIIIGSQLAAFISGDSNVLFVVDSAHGTVPLPIMTSWEGSQLSFSVNHTRALMNISNYLHTVIAFYDKS